MMSLRALLLLAAVSAAFAATIPAGIHLEIQSASTQLLSQIRKIETQGAVSDIVDKAIKNLEDLAGKIKDKVLETENELIDLLQNTSEAVATKLNELITKITQGKLDLELDDKWSDFESKTAQCSDSLQDKLKEILQSIKSTAENCSAKQKAEAKDIATQLIELLDLVEAAPGKAIEGINECNSDSDDSDDSDSTDDSATTDASTDSDTTVVNKSVDIWPEVIEVGLQRQNAASSISDAFKKAQCIAGKLWDVVRDLKTAPKLVSLLVEEVEDLFNKKTVKALEQCVSDSVSGKATELQQAAADAAYCLIAPTQQ